MEKEAKNTSSHSLNPFVALHSDVFELVFQHFDFSDLIKFSQVNKNAEHLLGESNKCMSKVNLIAESLLEESLNDITTKRRYQNISLMTPRSFEIVKKFDCRWKVVKVETQKFTTHYLKELLQHIQPSVEELVLKIDQLKEPPIALNLNFPRLRSLTTNEIILQLLSNCQLGLRTLNLRVCKEYELRKRVELGENVKRLLRMCENLEDLTLSNWKLSSTFTADSIHEMKFNLVKLKISFDGSLADADALDSFLKAKSSNIVKLSIDGKANNSLLATVYKIPKLKILKISKLIVTHPLNIELNSSITHLHILDKNLISAHQTKIIQCSPNLIFLSIHALNNQNIEVINANCKKLEWLSIAYVWLSSITADYFPNLKRLDIAGDVQYLLEQEILCKDENLRTKFEKMILKAI